MLEISPELLKNVKDRLRVDNDAYDSEIKDLIYAGMYELERVGVRAISTIDDPLINHAVGLYCKAYFGYDNPDADRFAIAFDSLETALKLNPDYTEVSS